MSEKSSKASLGEVSDAINALVERKGLTSVAGCIAYKKAYERVFAKMGWTRDEFIEALTQRIIDDRE
jgi:hypothetical protein